MVYGCFISHRLSFTWGVTGKSVCGMCIANKKLVPLLQLVLSSDQLRNRKMPRCVNNELSRLWTQAAVTCERHSPRICTEHMKNLSQEWLSQGLRRIRYITNSKQTLLPPQPWRSVKPPYSDTWVIYCHHFIWQISFATFCQPNYSINLAPIVYCPYRRLNSGGQ
jgi:hypothetical protein